MDNDRVATHDEKIVVYLRTALILLSEHYKEEVADYCQFALSCDDAVATDVAKKVLLKCPKHWTEMFIKERGCDIYSTISLESSVTPTARPRNTVRGSLT